jgi:hypothetical protein
MPMAQDPLTRAALDERIEHSWGELDGLATSLDGRSLETQVAAGWTVKDHLLHLSAWEESLLGLLDGRDRAAAMGLPGMGGAHVDTINAAVFEQHRADSPADALARFRQTHRQLLDRLGELSDQDLSRPYSDFQPGTDDSRPVGGWIVGNTFEHYDEHLAYIRQALKAGSGNPEP